MDVAQPPEEDQLGGGKADGEEDDDLEEQGEEFAKKAEEVKKKLEAKAKELTSGSKKEISTSLTNIEKTQERGRQAALARKPADPHGGAVVSTTDARSLLRGRRALSLQTVVQIA